MATIIALTHHTMINDRFWKRRQISPIWLSLNNTGLKICGRVYFTKVQTMIFHIRLTWCKEQCTTYELNIANQK